RGHFYSPLPDTEDVRARPGLFEEEVDELPGIDLRAAEQVAMLEAVAAHNAPCPLLDPAAVNLRFHLDQAYFLHGDVIALHGLMCHYRPRRIIEVGSGFSSAVMLDTADMLGDT